MRKHSYVFLPVIILVFIYGMSEADYYGNSELTFITYLIPVFIIAICWSITGKIVSKREREKQSKFDHHLSKYEKDDSKEE